MSGAVQAKARRLLAEGRVEPLNIPVRLYKVKGDTGTYIVTMSASIRSCDCEHGKKGDGDCSHLIAVREMFCAEEDFREGKPSRRRLGLYGVLDDRKAL